MRKAHLEFALKYKDKKLEWWKNVIFSDETSIVLGRQHGKTWVWRQTSERFDKTCIWQHWKKCTEFMFWGSFSYDKKGSCHIWKNEMVKEKKEAEEELEALNTSLEPAAKEAWELDMRMSHLNLR